MLVDSKSSDAEGTPTAPILSGPCPSDNSEDGRFFGRDALVTIKVAVFRDDVVDNGDVAMLVDPKSVDAERTPTAPMLSGPCPSDNSDDGRLSGCDALVMTAVSVVETELG
jgi:hypothetical protein